MGNTVRGAALALVSTLVLGASTWGQSVHVVAGDGSGDFAQLTDAVAAAAEGDVILVRPHTERYGFATIDGKSLTIVGEGPVRPQIEDVRVRDLDADQTVVLRFLDFRGRSNPHFLPVHETGLRLLSNAGCVWLEDLVVAGADGIPKSPNQEGVTGLIIGSSCIIGVDCEVQGGFGAYSVGGSTYPGGRGSQVTNSQAAFHGCTFSGGQGADELKLPAAPGGVGIDSGSATLFLSGSSLSGGDTGTVFGTPPIDAPAAGLLVRNGSTVSHLATTFTPGSGPNPGSPIDSSGAPSTVVDLDDDHRAIKLPTAVREGESARLTYTGQPGDLVLLEVSPDPAWTYVPAVKGVLHRGVVADSVFLGVANGNGVTGLLFIGPRLPSGVEAVTGYAQPVVAETDGSLRVGAPSSILLLNAML